MRYKIIFKKKTSEASGEQNPREAQGSPGLPARLTEAPHYSPPHKLAASFKGLASSDLSGRLPPPQALRVIRLDQVIALNLPNLPHRVTMKPEWDRGCNLS